MTSMLLLFVHAAGWGLMLAGAFFIFTGALGLIRLPGFYARLHGAGITDTLGAELLILGLITQAGFSLDAVKLLLIGLITFFTSPTAAHAIANAAYVTGLRPEPHNTSGPKRSS
ncbi:MAG: monovalent cation/H(+) antiporter subunit G [Parvularculales bacterium]